MGDVVAEGVAGVGAGVVGFIEFGGNGAGVVGGPGDLFEILDEFAAVGLLTQLMRSRTGGLVEARRK